METSTIVLILLAFGLYMMFRQMSRTARRAEYNRKIGEPDLKAPMPSEVYSTQRSIRGFVMFIVVVIVLGMFFGFFGGLLAVLR